VPVAVAPVAVAVPVAGLGEEEEGGAVEAGGEGEDGGKGREGKLVKGEEEERDNIFFTDSQVSQGRSCVVGFPFYFFFFNFEINEGTTQGGERDSGFMEEAEDVEDVVELTFFFFFFFPLVRSAKDRMVISDLLVARLSRRLAMGEKLELLQ